MEADLSKLLSGARQMQEKLETVQKDLQQIQVTGTAGGDMVRVDISGERRVQRVQISEAAMADKDMLQDLLASAMTNALDKAEAAIKEKMQASLLAGAGNLKELL